MKHVDDTPSSLPGAPCGTHAAPVTPGDGAAATRRRLLLRAAASSAPMVMGLIPGSAAAASSAFRLAEKDATQTPIGFVAALGADNWLRSPAETYKIVKRSNGATLSGYDRVFLIGSNWYTASSSTAAGVDVTLQVNALLAETNGGSGNLTNDKVKTGDVLVLRLFDECTLADSSKVWPAADTSGNLQGLSTSAWTSIAGATRTCNLNGA